MSGHMIKRCKIRQMLSGLEIVIGSAVILALIWAVLRAVIFSFAPLPQAAPARLRVVAAQLNHLQASIRQDHADAKMQRIFPEGACFLLTLYGLAWANVAEQTGDAALRERARVELRWTLARQNSPPVAAPFHDTQVRRGVFWMGQRNLLLGRTLEAAPAAAGDMIDTSLTTEFHANSRALAEAFLANPTHHLDSYTGECWPADNVTALASLLVHDRLYKTDYGKAYRAWKEWTREHADPPTGLPAGKLDGKTGHLGEPARGCANSWITGILGREDPEFAREFYRKYREHFAIRRLGFGMFREYPAGCETAADVDSGPIVWGAGMTATGAGLAAARAAGDLGMANDIYALAGIWGWPRWGHVIEHKGKKFESKDYLWGLFPMGDAFLAWGLSIAPPPQSTEPISPPPTIWPMISRRFAFYLCALGLIGLLGLREYFAIRKFVSRMKKDDSEAETVDEGKNLADETTDPARIDS